MLNPPPFLLRVRRFSVVQKPEAEGNERHLWKLSTRRMRCPLRVPVNFRRPVLAGLKGLETPARGCASEALPRVWTGGKVLRPEGDARGGGPESPYHRPSSQKISVLSSSPHFTRPGGKLWAACLASCSKHLSLPRLLFTVRRSRPVEPVEPPHLVRGYAQREAASLRHRRSEHRHPRTM